MGKKVEYSSLDVYKKNVEAAACCFVMHVVFNPFTQKLEYYKNVPAEVLKWAHSILGFDFFGDKTKDPSMCWANQPGIKSRYSELNEFPRSPQFSSQFRKFEKDEIGWLTPLPTTK